MRKLFFLIPAMLLALMANAITPGTKALYNAYNAAQAGSTIVLEAGTYDETERLIFTKDMTIMAAEGAEVIVKTHKDNQIKEGAKVKFIGIKFDGSEMTSSYEYFIRSYDATDGKELRFEKCEMTGFAGQFLIHAADATRTLDSVIINDCKCIGNSNDAIYIGAGSDTKETAKGIIVKNSTFANFSNLSHSVIEVRNYGSTKTPNIEVTVDHCTFYNNPTSASGYADIRVYKSTKVAISNCIFAHPDAYSYCATYCYGGTINNCLTYHYSGGTKGHRADDIDLSTCLPNADPLFTDAAHGNFTLAGNYITGEISPARGAATDGSDLGDPRWYTPGTYYTTDFADAGYAFTADKAELSGNIVYETGAPAPQSPYLRYSHSWKPGEAVWTIRATRACYVSATVNMADNTWNYDAEDNVRKYFQNHKHIFIVEVRDSTNTLVGSVQEGDHEEDGTSDGWATYPTVNLQGSIFIPKAGVYTVKLRNNRNESRCGVGSVTLTYVGGEVQAMPGITNINDAWFSPEGTRANGYIDFPNSTIQNGWVKWNVLFNKTSSYKAIVKINATSGHNYTVKLYRDENDQDPITFANGAQYSQTGEPVELEIEPQLIESGSYILEVVNGLQNSDAQLISVQFVRQGGGLVDMPGAINFEEAIFSTYAWLNESGATDTIHFARPNHEEYAADEDYTVEGSQYVKWRVNVTKSGKYQFVANTYCKQGHNYRIMLLSEDETSTIQSQQEVPGNGHAWNSQGADLELKTDVWELAKGNYVLKMQARELGRLMSLRGDYLGGAVDTIPGTIDLADALLSDRAYRDNDGLHFTDADHYSTIANESATWNIYATAGVYDFTLNVVGTNHGIYQLIVKDSQNNEVATKEKGKSGAGTVEIKSVFFPADGNYTIRLANVNNYANGYLTALSAAKQDIVVLDEAATNNSVLTANYNVTKNFILKRTFKGGMYNTICLPFEIGSQGTMESIFGVGYELVKLSDATISPEGVLTVEVENSVTLEHGVPYFIKPAADIVNPVFNNRKIKDTEMSDFSRGDVDFVGTFIKSEIPASEYNLFLGENNLLYFPMANTPIKGYRAYFRINNPNSAPVRQARIVTREQVITEIDLVGEENNTVKTIENGQLIIIKNGIRYNVMGAKIQ